MYVSQTAAFGPSLTNSFDTRQQFDRGIKNPEGRSLITGPIPPTPGFDPTVRPISAPDGPSRVARVHGTDAKLNYKRATMGTGIPFAFEVQGSGIFSRPNSASKPPINHLNENVKRIHRIARQTRQRQQQQQQQTNKNEPLPAKALWRSKQYDHVQSRVKQQLDDETQRSLSRPPSAQGHFLRAHGNTGPTHLRSQSAQNSRRNSISSLPEQTSARNDSNQVDFVKMNANYVKTLPKTRKASTQEMIEQAQEKKEQELKAYVERNKGRVPDYIERIKEQRIQQYEEARANAPDPDCPPGHVKVDNNQRLSTLQQLHSNRAELEQKLSHLPIRNDSLTLRRTKEDIEKKIIELDEAIKIFSKPKVFIRLEE